MNKIKNYIVFLILLSMACLAQDNGGDAASKPVLQRIKNRDFPSVFQAWNEVDNLPNEDALTTIARHDLIFATPDAFGLKWNNRYIGLADAFEPETIPAALEKRNALLKKNPNILILAEIRYRDASRSYLPQDHNWYMRDPNGIPLDGWEEGKFWKLDFANPDFREQVSKQAKAAVESGAFDGVMLDWWRDDKDRLELIKAVRKAVGPNGLILCNANDITTPNTAPYINGYFMECYRTKTVEDWKQIADTLHWAQENLRKPNINCLETWYHNSRDDLNLMRATTTLAMTLSDGYCLFSDPNPLPRPDHLHNWYPFWDVKAGKPTAKGKLDENGCYVRTYENATVIYNPMGNKPAFYTFPNAHKSTATGKIANEHTIQPCDGDILLNQ